MKRYVVGRVCSLWFLACGAAMCALGQPAAAGVGGKLTLQVIDRDTQRPVACRMHLSNAAGRALKAPRVPFWHDHFVFDGQITLKLPKGRYQFTIERGLEYLVRTGHFTIEDYSQGEQVVDLKRFADLAGEGWWSGDLDAARPAADLELLMRADDLHVVELITWPNRRRLLARTRAKDALVRFDENRYYHRSAGIDARGGGTLLFYNLDRPLDIGGLRGEYPSQQEAIAEAKSHDDSWVDARHAYGWDVPLWVACGGLDSVQVLNNELRRDGTAVSPQPGKPRDELMFPAPRGGGRWMEAIYYHLLNCGLRIPPTAGSGSGEVANPLGYNRMYVHVDGEFSYQKWWEAAKDGRIVVTNGPLIRPNVEGQMPGYVFRADAGQQVELEVGLTLSTRDRVAYLEIIKNGEIAELVRLDDWAAAGGRLPPVVFDQSGWMLIRAVTELPNTYRYAMTAPYYVEIDDRTRISKASAQFFLDWAVERMEQIDLPDSVQREAVLKYHEQAVAYWRSMVERANAP